MGAHAANVEIPGDRTVQRGGDDVRRGQAKHHDDHEPDASEARAALACRAVDEHSSHLGVRGTPDDRLRSTCVRHAGHVR
eukprot:272575-Prymnesium_polylepis.1